jgi:DNA polymerase-3 subunit gamma/tau
MSLFGDDEPAGAGAVTPYVVLARKYRPATFEDLIGQDAMVRTLRNAFASDRIAQGYMLTGVRGVGKTTTARILARALNYAREGLPDKPSTDVAELGIHCRAIMESRHPDVVEMDAASNTGIENIREIIEQARYKPVSARYKVFIIDEVHMLSKGAFNALLKTLEEPPGHVKFIFATTEIRRVPVTVLSRCQRFDLRRVDVPTLAAHFERIVAAEGAEADDEALALVARAAGGSVRDGLSVLDQAIATAAGAARQAVAGNAAAPSPGTGDSSQPKARVTFDLVRAMLGLADRGRLFDLLEHLFGGRAAEALAGFESLHADGADPLQVLEDLAEAVHVAARFKVAGDRSGGDALSAEEKRRAGALAGGLALPVLSRAWQMLLKGLDEATRAPDSTAAAEMVLIRLAHAADLPGPEEIIRALGGGAARRAAPAGGSTPRDAPPREERRAPLNAAPSMPGLGEEPPPPTSLDDYGAAGDEPPDEDHDDEGAERVDTAPLQLVEPRSFVEVVQLAGQRRDALLKTHLEEHVSLVKFDPVGAIELRLLPGAPAELANALREKLNKWTAKRWTIALSRSDGELPLGEQERRRKAAELEALKAHPAVAGLLQAFPGAVIGNVTAVEPRLDDERDAG